MPVVGDIRTLVINKNVVSGQEPVGDPLTYSMAPGYLEPLMAEGKIGNKLHLLGLTPFMKPAIFLKVDTIECSGMVENWRPRKVEVEVFIWDRYRRRCQWYRFREAIHEHNQQERPHPHTIPCTLNLFVPCRSHSIGGGERESTQRFPK